MMIFVIGTLDAESQRRLCNAYLTGDQKRLGAVLIGAAIAAALLWRSIVAASIRQLPSK